MEAGHLAPEALAEAESILVPERTVPTPSISKAEPAETPPAAEPESQPIIGQPSLDKIVLTGNIWLFAGGGIILLGLVVWSVWHRYSRRKIAK